jgi:hypothetical protein
VSSNPPFSGAQPVATRSIIAVALAMAGCQHPALTVVSTAIDESGGKENIGWCALCGAMRSDQERSGEWQQPVLAMLLASRPHLDELSRVLRALRRWSEAIEREGGGDEASASGAALDADLRETLPSLMETALCRDLELLDSGAGELTSPSPTER